MELKKRVSHPLVIVIAAISIIEVAMTVLYPQLRYSWEKVPTLIVILLIPLSVVGAFIYLWISRPGFLYPPSEYGSDEYTLPKMFAMDCGGGVPPTSRTSTDKKKVSSGQYSEGEETEQ